MLNGVSHKRHLIPSAFLQGAGNELDFADTGIAYEFKMKDVETVEEMWMWLSGTCCYEAKPSAGLGTQLHALPPCTPPCTLYPLHILSPQGHGWT